MLITLIVMMVSWVHTSKFIKILYIKYVQFFAYKTHLHKVFFKKKGYLYNLKESFDKLLINLKIKAKTASSFLDKKKQQLKKVGIERTYPGAPGWLSQLSDRLQLRS